MIKQIQPQQNYLHSENNSPPVSATDPVRPNLLSSLLSGKQSTSKKSSSKSTRVSTPKLVNQPKESTTQQQHEISLPQSIPDVEDDEDDSITDNLDSSFTQSKSNDFRKDHDVIELEKRIFKDEMESISAKDFFARMKKSKPVEKEATPMPLPEEEIIDIEEDATIIDLDVSNDDSVELVEVTSTPDILEVLQDAKPAPIDTKELESKIFGADTKRTSAKDIFRTFKPVPAVGKKSKKPNSSKADVKPTMFITLKVNSTSLKEIQKFDNPLKTRGNVSHQGSFETSKNQSFFHRPESLGKEGRPKKETKSAFASMMSASKNSVKLTPLQKLKVLAPPTLTKDQFHITGDNRSFSNTTTINLPFARRSDTSINKPTIADFGVSLRDLSEPQTEEHSKYIVTESPITSKEELVNDRIPEIDNDSALESVFEKFIINHLENDNHLLWTDLFQPGSTEELLIAPRNRDSIQNWISNSFKRLKAQTLKNPRNVMLKQKKKKQNKTAMDGFIVDDSFFAGNESETEEEIFVPLLILHGSSGSCKSSSVYAVMKSLNGYVHEINSGMQRGRKDIYNGLKEFSTTQLVHKQNESKQFQQGLILFEDVNILFEQDKNFWSVVHDILNISRRPIVITCEDTINIPKSLIDFAQEEGSIIELDQNIISQDLVIQYLWLCCLSQGYDVGFSILQDVTEVSFNGFNYDLRRCLNDLQFVCQRSRIPSPGVILEINKPEIARKNASDDLLASMQRYDLLSSSDVIDHNCKSQINHEVLVNELADIYSIDDSTQLKSSTLPFELNIGNYILDHVADEYGVPVDIPQKKYSFNQLRREVLDFIGSRSKKLPKFLQELQGGSRALRSSSNISNISSPGTESDFTSFEALSSNWTPEQTGVPDFSFINHISQQAFILDLLPMCRWWSRYQITLDRLDRERMNMGSESLKKSLNYRDFQYHSSILDESI
ncbi:uncharacterized protein RJT20DRAFT_100073 [Scheffersomyces xylosifermentans]|uniref:uncharacterized protein n=1 Tax=Scheffersomyces xylosifermentans TaxID=1304137 RepID=UPI00315C5DC0